MKSPEQTLALDYRIDLMIIHAEISDEVIQCLCEDSCYHNAFYQMKTWDEGSFHDLFSNGETYQSIFHHFIKNVKGFRLFYRSDLHDLIEQELKDNGHI